MIRVHRTSHRWFQGGFRGWLWLVLIALVATRLADVHLHLCFDGQEPRSAVHMADGAIHADEHHTQNTHSDRDVNVAGDALLKKTGDTNDLLILAFFPAFLYLLRPARNLWSRFLLAPAPARSLFLLRPPLRGPPR